MVTFRQLVFAALLTFVAKAGVACAAEEDAARNAQTVRGSTRNVLCQLGPLPTRTSVHRRGSSVEIIQETMQKYGIRVDFADAPDPKNLRFDLDDADFATTEQVLGWMTHLAFVPIETHRLLAFQDTPANRMKYQNTRIIPLNGLSSQDRDSLDASLHSLFNISVPIGKRPSMTLSSDPEMLQQVESLVRTFQTPRPNVGLNIKIYWTNASRERNAGVKTPQNGKVFSLLTEAEKLISDNQTIVNELISEGLVSASDQLEIALLLLSYGYGSSSLLSSPFVYFGGGETYMGASVDSPTLNMSLTNSVLHEIDETRLQLADGEKGNLHLGDRYPIKTASSTYYTYSTSDSKWSSSTTPTISYEDIGLKLQAEPHVQHNGSILLNLTLDTQSIAGSSINEIPILDHRQYTNSLVLPVGKQTLITSHVNRNLISALTGIPGLAETNRNGTQAGYTLIITITPELSPEQQAGSIQ